MIEIMKMKKILLIIECAICTMIYGCANDKVTYEGYVRDAETGEPLNEATITFLTKEEKDEMLNLAGKKRKAVAPDLPEYIMQRDYVSAALRTARDLDAGEEEWQRFVEELRKRKG